VLLELIAELVVFAALVVCGYAGIKMYVSYRQPQLAALLVQRRLAVLASLMLAAIGVKIFEDVLGNESSAVDTAVLWFIHRHVPAAFGGFFDAVTVSGSAVVLGLASAFAAAALMLIKRRLEAGLIVASVVMATLFVYVIKTLSVRDRPGLWETQWYWGSSFPSGHTLATAAFSIAVALCLARIWPRSGVWAMAVALAWSALVALSRLVLGVHWPTDVLAALCLGIFIPLAISMYFDLRSSSGI
jgi:undecaprenyl-diphosphatase